MTRVLSPATKDRMSAAREGFRHAPETRAKIGERAKGNRSARYADHQTLMDAIILRRSGLPYAVIAAMLGYSAPGVLRMVQRVEGEP